MIGEVKKANPGFRIAELCRVFEISCSSFYYKPMPQSVEKQMLIQRIEQAFSDSYGTYGKRRIQADVVDLECKVGVYAIASIMKNLGLKAIRPKKKHYYPNADNEQVYAPNLLKRQFNPTTYNTHWVGDITYIKSHQGWSYLTSTRDNKCISNSSLHL